MLQKTPTIPSCSGRWWKHPVKPNARPDGHGHHGCRRSRWNPTQRIPNVEINGCNRCSGRSGSLWVFESIWMSLFRWVMNRYIFYIYMYMIMFQRGFHRASQDLVKMMWETPKWCKKGPQRTSVHTNPGLWSGTNQWSQRFFHVAMMRFLEFLLIKVCWFKVKTWTAKLIMTCQILLKKT